MRILIAAALAVLALAGCSSDGSEPPAAPTGDARVFPGGQPLEHYKEMDSYPWRVAIVDQQDDIVDAMQEVNPGLDEGDLDQMVETCDAIARGIDGGQLTKETATRYGVDFGEAAELVLVAEQYACP